jgi:hypothetical protein
MPIEAALVKPVVDALLALFQHGSDRRLKRNASAALREAIRELLLANPDENRAAARIAIAKAAGILSEDIVLAEDMLAKNRASRASTRGKAATGRRRPVPPKRDDGDAEPDGTRTTTRAATRPAPRRN